MNIKPAYTSAIAYLAYVAVAFGSSAACAEQHFDFFSSTPVGSWAEREYTTSKDKNSFLLNKISRLPDVKIKNESYVVIEKISQEYKIVDGKREPYKGQIIFQATVGKAHLQKYPENVLANLRGYATSIVAKKGDRESEDLDVDGNMALQAEQSTGINFEHELFGSEEKKVSVPAGEFKCLSVKGKMAGKVKIIVMTMSVESEIRSCYSNSMPFGLIQTESDMVIRGQAVKMKIELMSYGSSGAKTGLPI